MLRQGTADRRKKSRFPCNLSRTVNGFTSIHDACNCVSVLEGSCTGSAHEPTGPERLIFAVVTVDLPSAQAAAGIHYLPSIALKHLFYFRRLGHDNRSTAHD